ncbi:PaaI family thioesterase [Sphingomonas morindae]|uniref:PaaI family thioesterase n=1 Tax=Sphingomonas morindae TaxID=1541170 RepID=A0ABY4X6W5_9SPHN|nr:PaaI family thioesterase [Sphingomonas morindae]USI72668.1 PaaI family thioesterase [Sphingomonas morindae]
MIPDLPPYARWLGVTLERAPDGGLGFRLPYGDTVQGRPGFFHGGALAGLLEIAAIGTLRDRLAAEAPGAIVKPITVTFDFLRGGRALPVHADASITRLGARIAILSARAWQDAAETPIAMARMTLAVHR